MNRLVVGWGFAVALAGCASTPTHFHSLAQLRPESVPSATKTESVVLSHLRVPVQADRMQITLHQSPTRLIVYERERWAAPLADQISAVLIGNLHEALPNVTITADPLLSGPHSTLQIDFEEFDAQLGQEARFRARWRLTRSDSTPPATGVYTSREALHSGDVDELVLAWSRGLSELAAQLAQQIN